MTELSNDEARETFAESSPAVRSTEVTGGAALCVSPTCPENALIYFSRGGTSMWNDGEKLREPGNTARLAAVLSQILNNDGIIGEIPVYRVFPKVPYPDDVAEAQNRNFAEQDSGELPPLASLPATALSHASEESTSSPQSLPDLSACEVLLLGFPIWGDAVPRVIDTFLQSSNIGDAFILPFCTWSMSPSHINIEGTLGMLAPEATIGVPLIIRGEDVDDENVTTTAHDWLASAGLVN